MLNCSVVDKNGIKIVK